jgi:purine-cytosine permease-like protein
MTEKAIDHSLMPRRKIHIFGRTIHLPNSKPLRIAIGVLLILFGILGFLPVLGFWMIPLGILVLSHDFAWARRQRRRVAVWWEKRRRRNGVNSGAKGNSR